MSCMKKALRQSIGKRMRYECYGKHGHEQWEKRHSLNDVFLICLHVDVVVREIKFLKNMSKPNV